ncbi:MAG: PEGA domain-containing protein [Lentisphaeria bacterium]|nr:PEGA domain-containing protein [Lentisphaeria bacterium]
MKGMMRIFAVLLAVVFVAAAGCRKKAPATGRIDFSGPASMEVTCAGKTFRGNPIVLSMRPGVRNFRFSAPGFYPRVGSVTVKPGVTVRVDVELEPVVSSVMIDSEPRGAKVIFQDKAQGATPLVISDLAVGEYSAQIVRPGYAEARVSWKIANERPLPLLFVKLKMTSGRLLVKTRPEAARVFINGRQVGSSPYNGTLESGVYTLRVERDGCDPREEQVTIVSGEQTSVDLALSSSPGSVEIASEPAGAELFIEGRKVGVTPWRADPFRPGNYNVKLVCPGYDTVERVVAVAPSRTEKVRFTLEKSTGSASFKIRPAGVSYLVDGKLRGTVQAVKSSATETKETVIDNLSPGPHLLTVTHPRARPLKRSIRFEVKKGSRYVAREVVELWVANCEITFKDGRVESGMIYGETETDVLYSPTAGIRYPVSRSYIRKIKFIPVTEK